MSEFEKNGFILIRNVLTSQTSELLATQFKLIRDVDKFKSNLSDEEFLLKNSDLIPNSYVAGGNNIICFEGLLLTLHHTIEKIVNKTLHPTYAYARIMQNGSSMLKHKDRIACEYSASVCIEVDDIPFPLWLKDDYGITHEIIMNAGDMLVYKGLELEHWRNEFEGTQHIQTFLHYVDADGLYTDQKYDGRTMIGL